MLSEKDIQLQGRNLPKYEKIMMQLIMIAPCFFIRFSLDNDGYWLIQSGRYVLQHGIPTIEPLTLHSGLHFVMQQWLSAVCFASIFDTFGTIGLLLFVLAVFIAMAFLIRRLCLLISGNNEFVGYVITILSIVVIWPFMTTRPFLISLLLFLIEILILEKHVPTGGGKRLIWLPMLSILLVNFHAAMWPFFFIIFIPYLIDSFRFRVGFIRGEGFPRGQLFFIFGVSFAAGFINPYGIKAMTYLFRSYGHQNISKNISEMQSPNFQSGTGFFVFAVLLLVILILIVSKPPKLKLRYGLLMLGTGFMALSSLRNLSLFAVCGMPMLAYVLRDWMPKTGSMKKISGKLQIALIVIFFCTVTTSFVIHIQEDASSQETGLPTAAIAYIQQEYQSESLRLYTGYNWGGYAEFQGLKPFIDARAEVFLKINNGKADILDDYINMDAGKMYYGDFIKKYQLNVFLVEKNELLNVYLGEDKNYTNVFQNKNFVVYEKMP